MNGFALLETMRAEAGAVRLIDRHCDRLQRSASFFAIPYNGPSIGKSIEEAARKVESPACLRLLLAPDGSWTIETRPVPSGCPKRLKLSSFRVSSTDALLRHKTTTRQLYEQAREGLAEDTDVVLVNERGEITETTIANVALPRNGVWVTPQVSCGLLAGVMRAELLALGHIVEGVIPVETLVAGETVRCFNALRGLFEAQLQLERWPLQ